MVGSASDRDGAARLHLADRVAVHLAQEYMPDQHHDEGEDGHGHDQAGEPEQLADQQHARDGDHRREVHLPLHDHRRDEVGLDQVDPDAEQRHRHRLGQAEDPKGKERRHQGGEQGSEERHDGGDPGEHAKRQKVGNPEQPESEGGERRQQNHRDDLPDYPGPEASL